MSEKTKIAWCDSTWNWVRGCRPVSPGCKNCYAAARAKRFGEDFSNRIRAAKQTFGAPLRWNRKPWVCDVCNTAIADRDYCPACQSTTIIHRRRVFSLSLGDIGDPEVPLDWFNDAMVIVDKCRELDFLLLTKRPMDFLTRWVKICKHWGREVWNLPPNVWMGVTCENQEQVDKRIPELLQLPARVRFLSCEPLLTGINIGTAWQWVSPEQCDKPHVDWIITGCESGPHRRNMDQVTEHARSIVQQCQAARVPVFVKQLPIDGKVSHDPQEWPVDLRVQDFPTVSR